MTPELAKLDEKMRRRGISSNVCARIVRLNPDYCEGQKLRGYHPNNPGRDGWITDRVSKGQFIRKFGRKAWDCLPNGLLIKEGRRRYISRADIEDNIWKLWSGELILPFMVWFPTRKYANDPGCVREIIPKAEWLERKRHAEIS